MPCLFTLAVEKQQQYKEIGQQIREDRQAIGYSVDCIAKVMKVSRQSIVMVESGVMFKGADILQMNLIIFVDRVKAARQNGTHLSLAA